MLATSSYVLFDLLDIDGSQLRQHAPVSGFEAVMPDASGEIKSPIATAPVPAPEPLRNLWFTPVSDTALTSRSILSSSTSILRIVRTRNATGSESASSMQGSEPAQRPA